MPTLGAELFERTVKCASGEYSVGEKAGHAQVSLWRNWNQTPIAGQSPSDLKRFEKMYAAIGGGPLGVTPGPTPPAKVDFNGYPGAARHGGLASDRIGLILPTSLCSGEVARKITLRLNAALATAPVNDPLAARVTRFECLPHTEGCGTGYAEGGMAMYSRIMVGHLTHPSVALALCLEHGCEKTHNDFFANAMIDAKIDGAAYGYASIQLDGGIEAVTSKVENYFARAASSAIDSKVITRTHTDVRSLDIGIVIPDKTDAASPDVAKTLAALARAFAAGGGCLVVPATSGLMSNADFTNALALTVPLDLDSPAPVAPTLAFGETVRGRGPATGVHIMDMPYVRDFTETVTGFAATGCHAVLVLGTPPAAGSARAPAGHPIVPVVHIGLVRDGAQVTSSFLASTDAIISSPSADADVTADAWAKGVLETLATVASGEKKTIASSAVFFNITRGPTGVST
jgi:altronate dehydratase